MTTRTVGGDAKDTGEFAMLDNSFEAADVTKFTVETATKVIQDSPVKYTFEVVPAGDIPLNNSAKLTLPKEVTISS